VVILKEVKVVCFDTLLQVLILKKVVRRPGGGGSRHKIGSPPRHGDTEKGKNGFWESVLLRNAEDPLEKG
jgi:hypothetical protein